MTVVTADQEQPSTEEPAFDPSALRTPPACEVVSSYNYSFGRHVQEAYEKSLQREREREEMYGSRVAREYRHGQTPEDLREEVWERELEAYQAEDSGSDFEGWCCNKQFLNEPIDPAEYRAREDRFYAWANRYYEADEADPPDEAELEARAANERLRARVRKKLRIARHREETWVEKHVEQLRAAEVAQQVAQRATMPVFLNPGPSAEQLAMLKRIPALRNEYLKYAAAAKEANPQSGHDKEKEWGCC